MAEKKTILEKAFDDFRYAMPCHIGQGDDYMARAYTFYVKEIFKHVADARLYAEILCPVRKQPFGKLADGSIMFRTVLEYYIPKLTGSDIDDVLKPRAASAYKTHVVGKGLKSLPSRKIEEKRMMYKNLLVTCEPSLRAHQRSQYLRFLGSISHQEIMRSGLKCDSVSILKHMRDYKVHVTR